MIKTFKWLYKLGYDNSQRNTINLISNMAQFHRQQAEISFYKKQEDDRMLDGKFPPKMSSQEHGAAAKILGDVLTEIDPQRYPNIDRMLEKML